MARDIGEWLEQQGLIIADVDEVAGEVLKAHGYIILAFYLAVCSVLLWPPPNDAWAQRDTFTEVARLIEELEHHEAQVRVEAAEALRKIGPAAKAAVPALIEALTDEHSRVQITAANALGSIGPEARASVGALIATLKDEESPARVVAAIALGNIGPEAKAAIGGPQWRRSNHRAPRSP